MARWQFGLSIWRYPIAALARAMRTYCEKTDIRSPRQSCSRRRRLGIEPLEERTLLAIDIFSSAVILAPTANDDLGSTTVNQRIAIDIFANDIAPQGVLDISPLAIVTQPAHGTVSLGYQAVKANNDGSPLGNGRAPALTGAVDQQGRISLLVANDDRLHNTPADIALYVKVGKSSFANFVPTDFDFSFRKRVSPAIDFGRDARLVTC